ncbi:calcitonin gene-related peptide type 1 receptor-like isoform X2 [Mustelus asterias]
MSDVTMGSLITCFVTAAMLTQSAGTLQESWEPAGYTTESMATDVRLSRIRIISAQYECYLKIISDPPYEKDGSYCNRTWDGWLCWDDAPTQSVAVQQCPDYYQEFDHSEKASKFCAENSLWFRHPESNRTWTNYTQCTAHTRDNQKVGCKVLHFIHLYLTGCNYFWMLCEGIYLHTLIIVAVFVEEQRLLWYYILGWGFPLVPAIIHAAARSNYFNDNCWMRIDTHLLYIVHGPICTALVVNLFFLLNIVRVLITKLRVTHQAQSEAYMKVVRATLILVPLLGIQFVLFPYKPDGRLTGEIYDHVMHIFMHFQGILVTTIFCFFNREVQSAFKRQWSQYKVQYSHQLTSTEGSHSNMTSLTEFTGYSLTQTINNNRTNGKDCAEILVLKEPGISM